VSLALRRYYYSGWAVLIPYLAAYLLYYVLRWPVNTVSSGAGIAAAGGSGVPCLLHVYWFLHATNAFLAVAAFFSASRSASNSQLPAILPWFLLALIFYVPGVYLEFPADPWQHYHRINEWTWLHTVGEHTYWTKSGYFLAYSLVGRITPPASQLFWLNFYYTGCCLLLCWQYYRLARAVGLGERASLLFVILQSVLFGNNIFGFYRYYGIATTIFAQVGAVALIRIAIDIAGRKLQAPDSKLQGEDAKIPQGKSNLGIPTGSIWRAAAACALGAACLLALIAFNHTQGLGIAALGIGSVILWRLVEWNRSAVWWLAAAALVLSAAMVLWWPRNPVLDSAYRPAGWLTPWYGFNVFSFQTDAGDRTRWIIGFFGLINLGAACALLRRNHLAGWLTITPILALCLPVFAIPFANALVLHNAAEGIITFTRMLFAIPAGLALIAAAQLRADRTSSAEAGPAWPVAQHASLSEPAPAALTRPARCLGLPATRVPLPAFLSSPLTPGLQSWAFPILLLSLAALLLVPANRPFYNRFWQALMVPANDLAMRPVIEVAGTLPSAGKGSKFDEPVPLTTPGIGYVVESTGRACLLGTARVVRWAPAQVADTIVRHQLLFEPGTLHELRIPAADVLYSPNSQSGFLSGHWLPCDVALELSTQEELFQPGPNPPAELQPPQLFLEWTNGRNQTRYYGKGAGVPVRAVDEDRGSMNSDNRFATPVAGDQLVLRPILRTWESNGWRISMTVTGPDSFHQFFEVVRQPNLLEGDIWIYSDCRMRFPKAGQYTIELVGDVVGAVRRYSIRYALTVAPGNAGTREMERTR
jgi:hypothetical protein